MIGVFDSGMGGLTVLKWINQEFPEYSTCYLGDNARTPYGNRDHEVIYDYTVEGVEFLLEKGCPLVIVACNTSSSQALPEFQQIYLSVSERFGDRRVLGVIRPTVEVIVDKTKTKKIGILATVATVGSNAYVREFAKISPEITVFQQACPLLVPIVEAGEKDWEGTNLIVKRYVGELMAQDPEIDVVLLGCTHYPVLFDIIKKALPAGVKLFEQGPFVAEQLRDYLKRHPEIDERLEKKCQRDFLTTSLSPQSDRLSEAFYGKGIQFKTINLK